MAIVERYHAPIRRAFNIITKEATGVLKEEALRMAVKAIKDSIQPDQLFFTLLAFGALPRLGLPTHALAPSTFKTSGYTKKCNYCYVKTICVKTNLQSTENQKRTRCLRSS